jgi:transposase
MSRRDVRRFLRAESFEDAFPEQSARHPRPNQLDRYAPYFRRRWEERCQNVAQLYRELLERGFCGAASELRAYLAPWRIQPPVELGRARGQLPHRATVWATPTPRCAAWLLLGCQRCKLSQKAGRNAAPSEKEAFAEAFVDCLCERCTDVQIAQTLSLAFFAMVRDHCADALDAWMDAARASGIVELTGVATGLSRDRAAVAAALSSEWSNGQVEGQVNRLKFLKRSMYGRGGFDLFKARVLHRADKAAA